MSLYSEWNRLLEEQEDERAFWEKFIVKEKKLMKGYWLTQM